MVISFNGGKDSVVLLQLINLGLQIQSYLTSLSIVLSLFFMSPEVLGN